MVTIIEIPLLYCIRNKLGYFKIYNACEYLFTLLFILFGSDQLLCWHMTKLRHRKVKQFVQSHTILRWL